MAYRNSQTDLQAMDRVHRTVRRARQAYVFQFITENGVEECMLERTVRKLRLDQLLNCQGREQLNKGLSNQANRNSY